MRRNEVLIGAHFYQPPRKATHGLLKHIETDPCGVDWNKKISEECYRPIAARNTLNLISFDFYGITRRDMLRFDPVTLEKVKESMKSNSIADPYIHPILPDLTDDDKRIVIGAGKLAIRKEIGKDLGWFWAPETSLDTQTLEILSENNYKGVIAAPWQIQRRDGKPADNELISVDLPSGKNITVLCFDRNLQQIVSDDKDGWKTWVMGNADRFYNEQIKPRLVNGESGRVVCFNDGETYGHHHKNADGFLDYLLRKTLPSENVNVVSINELDISQRHEGRLYDRSAWSCKHDDLIRWRGSCDCCFGADTRWKNQFYSTFANLNEAVTEIVKRELGSGYMETMVQNFVAGFENEGGDQSTNDLSLISAKVSSLSARTSCGTFFDNPGVAGRFNILFAAQTIAHLKDAGIKSANKLGNELYIGLERCLTPQQLADMISPRERELINI